MILTRDSILKEIQQKNIQISPFKNENLGPASYDITLDSKIRVFKKIDKPYAVNDKANYKEITELLDIKDKFTLEPDAFILGITEEIIELPGNICAWIQGRSSFARLGLAVHITASFVQPGVKNQQVFEILNTSSIALDLIPGIRIAQLIFQRCEGFASYKGKFNHQEL